MQNDHVPRTWPYDPAGLIVWSAAAMLMPLLASRCWWDAFRNAAPAARTAGVDARTGHALIVPPPIEDDGEHGLFA